MFARVAWRSAPIITRSTRYAQRGAALHRVAAVRFNSTVSSDGSQESPAPSTSELKPGPSYVFALTSVISSPEHASRTDPIATPAEVQEEDEADLFDGSEEDDALDIELPPEDEAASSPSAVALDALDMRDDATRVDPSVLTEAQLSSLPFIGRSVIEPLYHPRTHGIPVATIHLRSHHPYLLHLFSHFSAHAASALGIPISKPTPLPMARNLWTVIKSPFAQKKSQENFERRTYKRVIKAWDADYEVINRWVRYLETNALAGVGIRVVKWDRAPVGVGQKVLGVVSAAVDPQGMLDAGRKRQIEALGQKIVEQELAAAINSPDGAVSQMLVAKSAPQGGSKAAPRGNSAPSS